jgi:hypothetical protein
MATEKLVKLQQASLQILNDYVLDPIILIEGCRLDYGRHVLNPKHDLGSFCSLSVELEHYILNEVDLKSLLVFRRACPSAMVTVNAKVEYHKASHYLTLILDEYSWASRL